MSPRLLARSLFPARTFPQLLPAAFLVLALIYWISPETGFINHRDAGLGKTVLSAGRNTSPPTARQGELAAVAGPGAGLRMALAAPACARAVGQGRGDLPHATCAIFQASPAVAGELLPPALGEAARKGGKEPKGAPVSCGRPRGENRLLTHLSLPFLRPVCASHVMNPALGGHSPGSPHTQGGV